MAVIHPTRTNLLNLKEKAESVKNSISILKARRQALIKEFLATVMPLLRSREEIRRLYGSSIEKLSLSKGHEGIEAIESISITTEKALTVEIKEKTLWGLDYKEIIYSESPIKKPEERPYDYVSSTDHLEESLQGFERIIEAMLEIANFESKIKRLAEDLFEREREAFYRLKIFKERI